MSRVSPWRTASCSLAGRASLAVVSSVAVLAAWPAAAEGPQKVSALVRDSAEIGSVELPIEDGKLQLALEDAIAIGLERNLDLRIERYSRSRSLLGVLEAMGLYDFNLGASSNLTTQTTPSVTELEATGGTLTEDAATFNVQVDRLIPTGGLVSLGFGNTWRDTNDANRLSPLYSTGLEATFRQPLLRNFGRLATERNILRARIDSRASREAFELAISRLIDAIHTTYWDLVEARQQLEVAEESLKLAKDLHEMNRVQVDVGTLAPLELITSEAGVAAREEDIIRFGAAVEDRADELRRLLNFDPGALWTTEILPVTDPAIPYLDIDPDEAIRTALDERPEVRQQRLGNEALEIDAKFFRNQRRPSLSFLARYGLSGVNVVTQENGPPLAGDYGDSLDQLSTTDSYNWEVGLTFSMPLENRTARARALVADLELERGQVSLAALEQLVSTQVRQEIRSVQTARQVIESAKIASKLARRNLEAEQKRYENGLSTSFKVLQIQEDLAQARSREVTAITGYRRALAAYQQGIGRLLEAYQVELEDAAGDDGYRELAGAD